MSHSIDLNDLRDQVNSGAEYAITLLDDPRNIAQARCPVMLLLDTSASMEGEPIQSTTFAAKRVLVLGSEGEGLSKRAKSKVKEMVSIEMKHQFDSLNVSAAAAILIHRMGYAIR